MPEAIMVVDRFDRKSGLFATISSQRLKVETQHQPRRCSSLQASYISKQFWGCASLSTRKAKDAIHYYRQVSVPRKAVLYASKPLTKVKINRVEPFSISFPRHVDFCFTSQKLITSDKSFYNGGPHVTSNFPAFEVNYIPMNLAYNRLILVPSI